MYFSDRRGDHNEDAATAHVETGEYGFEDFVNPANADGAPNNTLDGGTTGAENVNELSLPPNTTRETYGEDPANCAGCNVFRRGLADSLQRQQPAVVVLHIDQRRKPRHRAHQPAGPLPAGTQARSAAVS